METQDISIYNEHQKERLESSDVQSDEKHAVHRTRFSVELVSSRYCNAGPAEGVDGADGPVLRVTHPEETDAPVNIHPKGVKGCRKRFKRYRTLMAEVFVAMSGRH